MKKIIILLILLLSVAMISSTERSEIRLGNGMAIPYGSTIVHSGNSTEIFDAQGNLWLRIDKAGYVPTPSGFQKATRVYSLPSGSFIKSTSAGVEVYHSGELILKIVENKSV